MSMFGPPAMAPHHRMPQQTADVCPACGRSSKVYGMESAYPIQHATDCPHWVAVLPAPALRGLETCSTSWCIKPGTVEVTVDHGVKETDEGPTEYNIILGFCPEHAEGAAPCAS